MEADVRVLMLFLDGVGIGRNDPHINALLAARLPAMRAMLGGRIPTLTERTILGPDAVEIPLDATMRVSGLPQSGTGQTALFAGVNAARIAGKHFGPHPYSTLRPIIQRNNIFQRFLDRGRSVCFANAYPQRFFDYVEQKNSRLSVTTLSCTLSGVPLLRAGELQAGMGISADITNEGWKNLGYPDMMPIEPVEAGRRLAAISSRFDFVLFEYWKTDYAGHSRNMGDAVHVLETFDGMLSGILSALDLNHTLLLLTSDHGNIEDMSTKTHTRHPVPLILAGARHDEFASRLRSLSRPGLQHVTPVLMDLV